jgi:Secretion system C-terminal sorting domain
MKIYPNPSGTDFTIEWDSREAVAMQMFDAKGQLSETMDISKMQNAIRWTPSNKEAGTYVVKLYNGRQEIIGQEKIIYLP